MEKEIFTSKKQYTITEENYNEGETFWYIVYLTNEEYNEYLNLLSTEDCCLTYIIEESNYTLKEITMINKHSDNTYMERLSIRKVSNIEEPYKWAGLKRVNTFEEAM
jgi:hypothetical protein